MWKLWREPICDSESQLLQTLQVICLQTHCFFFHSLVLWPDFQWKGPIAGDRFPSCPHPAIMTKSEQHVKRFVWNLQIVNSQGENHLFDELAFLKWAAASWLQNAVSLYVLQDHYFWGGNESQSFAVNITRVAREVRVLHCLLRGKVVFDKSPNSHPGPLIFTVS